jgi:hypothetical protein
MAQALPNNINLASQKPQAVPSYVRRFKNVATNSASRTGQQQEIIIPIDTGTPGAFLDCSQSFLQFDLQITNSNPYIDYVNFGRSGGNALIEVMTIRCQGNPIETIREYNMVTENWAMIEGTSQEPFRLYVSRKNSQVTPGWMTNSINNLKPPMVDLSGRIMAVQSGRVATPIGGAQRTANTTVNNVYDVNSNVTQGTQYGYDHLYGINYLPYCFGGVGDSAVSAVTSNVFGAVNYQGVFNSQIRNMTLLPGVISRAVDTTNPFFWPQMIGIELPDENMFSKNNLRFQDYMSYLSNVKCIPVGCRTALSPGQSDVVPSKAGNNPLAYTQGQFNALAAGGWSNTILTPNPLKNFIPGLFSVTLCLPVISGLIGVLADKMAPTMLLDNFQLVLTTASYGKVFKVTMDPCRRIVGTHRDFSIWQGNNLDSYSDGTGGTLGANFYLPQIMTQQIGNGLNMWGAASDTNKNPMNYQPNQDYITDNSGTQSVAYSAGAISQPPFLPFMLTNGSTYYNGQTGQVEATTYGVGYELANPDNTTIYPFNNWFFPANSGIPQYYHNRQQNLGTVPINVNNVIGRIGNDATGCYGTFLESSVPQTARCIQNSQNPGAGNVQRFTDTNQGVSDAMPQYMISNVYFVATQVIVPDAITAEILSAASYGDISLQTHTIQVISNIQLTPGSSSQNIIIPAKIASANALYGIFRTNEQVAYSMKQYLVNSLSGICPIGSSVLTSDSVSYVGTNFAPNGGNATQGSGLGTVYVPSTSGQFSFQLKIGNDLVPLQPINSATEILVELEKCTHGLQTRYNNMAFGNPLIQNPNQSTAVPGALVYDIFTDGGFFTTYVDPYFLNDQTIVNNAAWAFMGSPPAVPVTIEGTVVTPSTSLGGWQAVPVGNYMCNRFEHPDGSFMIGIDLDTWSGMSNVALSGRYIGNNNCSLQCEGLSLIANLQASGGVNGGSTNSVNFTAMFLCDARWSFQAGGNSQVFT